MSIDETNKFYIYNPDDEAEAKLILGPTIAEHWKLAYLSAQAAFSMSPTTAIRMYAGIPISNMARVQAARPHPSVEGEYIQCDFPVDMTLLAMASEAGTHLVQDQIDLHAEEMRKRWAAAAFCGGLDA
jgi:hypothetical protein